MRISRRRPPRCWCRCRAKAVGLGVTQSYRAHSTSSRCRLTAPRWSWWAGEICSELGFYGFLEFAVVIDLDGILLIVDLTDHQSALKLCAGFVRKFEPICQLVEDLLGNRYVLDLKFSCNRAHVLPQFCCGSNPRSLHRPD